MKRTMKVSEEAHKRLTEFKELEGINTYSDAIIVLLERTVRVVDKKDVEKVGWTTGVRKEENE